MNKEKYLELIRLMIRDSRGADIKDEFLNLGKNITDIDIERMLFSPYVANKPVGPYHNWPLNGETMTSIQSLEFLHRAVKDVVDRKIDGDIVETGVWKGGSIIAMKAAFDTYEKFDRKFYVCDSFEGCPPPKVFNMEMNDTVNDPDDNHFNMIELQVSEEDVRNNFKKYDLLDDRVIFIKGWFHETMPVVAKQIEKISILRLDGDLYISTWPVLENLYNKIQAGGYVILDDVGLANHDRAVAEFRKKYNITSPIIRGRGNDGTTNETDNICVHYWIKE